MLQPPFCMYQRKMIYFTPIKNIFNDKLKKLKQVWNNLIQILELSLYILFSILKFLEDRLYLSFRKTHNVKAV